MHAGLSISIPQAEEAPPTHRIGQIEEQMNRLDSSITAIGNGIGTLEARLCHVLRQPEKEKEDTAKAPSLLLVPLADQCFNFIARLDGYVGWLASLTDRIEL